jgi:cytochrome c553
MRPLRSLLLAASLAVSACGGFDAGDPYHMRPRETVSDTDPSPSSEEQAADAGTHDDEDASTDQQPAPGPAPDSGTLTPKPDAFTGAAAYAATTGATTIQTQHNFAGSTPTTNPAGQPCLKCHGAAGPAPRFTFGGTIYKDATGTPASQIEVRVVGTDGVARSTYTDANGNFFFPFASGAVKFPAAAGARDADTKKSMTTTTANGNCNSCHKAGGTSPPLVVQ